MSTKTLTNELSVKELIAELTLEEKVNFLTTVTACTTWESKERNIFPFVLEDGATGVNGNQVVLDFLALMAEQANDEQSQENPFVGLPALMGVEEDEAQEKAVGNPLYMGFLRFLKNGAIRLAGLYPSPPV